jgi:hypothetical protein
LAASINPMNNLGEGHTILLNKTTVNTRVSFNHLIDIIISKGTSDEQACFVPKKKKKKKGRLK